MRSNYNLIKIAQVCLVFGMIFVPTAIFSQQKRPASVSIFGQEIGAPLSLPACPKVTRKIKGKNIEFIASENEIAAICYVGTAGATSVLAILIPDGKRPLYIRRGYGDDAINIRAFIIEGIVQGIDFKTAYGEQEQKDALFSDLEVKFGQPTKTFPREWQNDNGAKYTRYEYEWNSPSHAVALSEKNIYGKFVNGMVTIYTPKAASFLADVEIEIKKKADEERRKKSGGL